MFKIQAEEKNQTLQFTKENILHEWVNGGSGASDADFQ